MGFLAVALAGFFFFSQAPRVWPLVQFPYTASDSLLDAQGRKTLAQAGVVLPAGYTFSRTLQRNEAAMDFVVRSLGSRAPDSLGQIGLPLLWYRLLYKKEGSPDIYGVQRYANGAVGWYRRLETDGKGDTLAADSALTICLNGMARTLAGFRADQWQLVEKGSRYQDARLDHWFLFERMVSAGFRMQLKATVSGSVWTQAEASWLLPASEKRAERSRSAWRDALFYGAIVAMAFFSVLALRIVLITLRNGTARPAIAAKPVLWLGMLLAISYAFDSARLYVEWDPLWPRWLASAKNVVQRLLYDIPMLLLLFFLALAGDATERKMGWNRAARLWDFLSGRGDWRVILGNVIQGYGVAFVAGALLVAFQLAFIMGGGRVQVQPQGFFGFALDSSSPGLATLVFFLQIALLEELGYRLFAQSLISGRWPHRWGRCLAVVLPSLVFGAIHAPMYFLPPLDPWWGRVLVMACIGVLWSFAAWRYGLLVVVVAHWVSDLFIFNWPRLAAGGVSALQAVLTVSFPLLMVLLATIFTSVRRGGSR